MKPSNGVEPEGAARGRFAAYAWGVTALTLAVILWGAYVRASRSGDGCGAHWPLCNGTVVPDATHAKTLVEFAHRATSGLAFLLVVGLVVWAFKPFRRGHPARAAAVASGVFIVTESLIGAGLVLLRLVADNASVARAAYLSVHLVNTFLLVAALALGVSGAVAALGATLFPESAQAGALSETSPSAQLLFSLRQYKLHPLLAVLVGGYLVYFARGAYRSFAGVWARRWAASVVALVAAQLGAGLLNAALLAPVWLQLIHLLLADLLWLALVLLSASSLAQTRASSEEFERVGLRTPVEI
jgi:cytochrome c oxidase assembly protein subunit 15